MNSEYFLGLAKTFEDKYGVKFVGIEDGVVSDEKERLIQYKTNIDVVMSVLDKEGRGDWIADKLVEIGDQVENDIQLRVPTNIDPFQDERLNPVNIPVEPQTVSFSDKNTGKTKDVTIKLFEKYGETSGGRRAISEIVKWMNYVTDNRMVLLAADLAGSINVDQGSIWGGFDPITNPSGIKLKSAIQEAGNASTAIGLISQSASLDPNIHSGVWALSGTYGAFTPLMYLPARVWSQQNQDSPFRVGVLNVLAGHSGPETAADARTHFGIFSPQVWKLFPRDQIINLNFWDYNDVAPGYFAAAHIASRDPKVGIIVIECSRPDYPVVDRNRLADPDIKAAAKGFYLIKDFDPDKPKQGYVVVQGASTTNNLISQLDRIKSSELNVRIISAISEELFNRQSQDYKDNVLPPSAKYNLMIVSTGTKRIWPVSSCGPLTEEYSLVSDWNDQWLSGGSETEVLEEAQLDPESIYQGIYRFANDYEVRKQKQSVLLNI
jgi:transketolase